MCQTCLKEGGAIDEKTPSVPAFSGGAGPPVAFVRPPRIAGLTSCRGCFNRCELLPGRPGVCGVKRNIAGRITHARLRIKSIESDWPRHVSPGRDEDDDAA